MNHRILWDLRVHRGDLPPATTLGVFLVEVPDGKPGTWPRLEALDVITLRTAALMWAPKTVWHPAGPRIEGIDDVDACTRVAWTLTNPRST